MKRIGILFGRENTFPHAFVERVNSKKVKGITAEFVQISKVMQGVNDGYAVIIDRISQDIPFYRAYLKNAAATGTAVINNPFWWSADDKFFNNTLALMAGVKVPRTVLLPSNTHPPDTDERSMRNLAYPLDWDAIFEYVGWPAFFKPFSGGGWKHVYKIEDREQFFQTYNQTGQLVMMLQEEIDFTDYYRCYCIGQKYVRIMKYDPKQPFHMQYVRNAPPVEAKLKAKLEDAVLRLCSGLGYDFNTVELAIRDGEPYAIDFGNPAPDADYYSVGEDNFEWVVETAAKYAIERAKAHKEGKLNLTWGKFITQAVKKLPVTPDLFTKTKK
jgi:glutathione synthase/RimK-type ligase-like ATP-grasp enzyme